MILAAARAASGVSGESLQDDLGTVFRHWRRTSTLVHDLPADASVTALVGGLRGPLLAALSALASFPDESARTMVGLTLILLADSMVLDGADWVATHVLFDAARGRSAARGAVGRLELTELPGGPPGLYPDPRYMAFLQSEPSFSRSLAGAWTNVFGGEERSPCVLWRLLNAGSDDGAAVQDVSGGSAGAAFGALLTALATRRAGQGGLRRRIQARRTLRGRIALTGTVDRDGVIGTVGGLDSKLTAAKDRRLHVVLPAADREQSAKVPAELEPHWVATVDQAYRRATAWPRTFRRVAIGTAVTVVLATVTAGAVYLNLSSGAAADRQDKIAVNLAAAARAHRDSDPGLAALLAAEAVAQSSSPATRRGALDELTGQIAYNGRLAGTIKLSGGQVSATAVNRPTDGTPETVLVGTNDGQLFAADPTHRRVLSRHGGAHDGGVTQVAVNPVVPTTFVSGGRDGAVRFWRLNDRRVEPVRDAKHERTPVWSLAYSPDGLVVVATDNQGRITLYDSANGALLTETRPHAVVPVQAAAITSVAFGPPGSGMLYAGTAAGRLVAVDYRPAIRTPAAAVIVTVVDSPSRGAARSLALVPDAGWYAAKDARAGVLLIGTDQGLQAWDLDGGREIAYPVAEITTPVLTLSVRGSMIAAGQEQRTTVLQYRRIDDPAGAVQHSFGIQDLRDGTLAGASLYDGGLLTPVRDGAIRVWGHERRPFAEPPPDTTDVADVGLDDGVPVLLTNFGTLVRYDHGRTQRADAGTGIGRATDLLAIPPGAVPDFLVAVDAEENAREPLVPVSRSGFNKKDGPVQEHLLAGCEGVTTVAFLPPHASRLAVGCRSGLVRIWDPATWRVTASRKFGGNIVTAFAAVGDTLVVGTRAQYVGDQGGRLFSVHLTDLSGSTVVQASPTEVTGLAVAAGRVIAAGDGGVRAYTPTLEPLTDRRALGEAVRALASDPIGGRVVAAVDDSLVLLTPERLEPVTSVPVGQPVTRLVADPARGAVVGRTIPVDSEYALAGAVTGGKSGALVWRFDTANLLAQACAFAGRDLTVEEARQHSGDSNVRPSQRCFSGSAAASATPAESTAPDGTQPGGILVTATEPARPRLSVDCQPLVTGDGYCGVLLGGEHDYAWTVTKGPEVEIDKGNYAHRMMLYRGTPDGTQWVPVLRTSDTWNGVQISVWPATERSGERTLAIGHRRVGRIDTTELSFVTEGRVEHALADAIAAEPSADGTRIWVGVYTPADSDCCPSNFATYVLRREPDGTYREHDRRAATRTEIVRR